MLYFSENLLTDYKEIQSCEFQNLTKGLSGKDREKLNSNILNPIAFLLVSEIKKPKQNIPLINDCLNYLLSHVSDNSIITVQNNPLYLPPSDTRGEKLRYTSINSSEEADFLQKLDKAKDLLGEKWAKFISIINVVTFVTITGKEELLTHFSGSNSDLWGAIHMNKNLDLINIIECLTHEASHHWLNLFEYNHSDELITNGWVDHNFISPWRRDRRPLMGIFHGVYVFGNVFQVYFKLLSILSNYDSDRMYYIGNQVLRGYEILEESSDLMIKPTIDFLLKSKNDFLHSFNQLDTDRKKLFYQKVLNQEHEKK